MVAMGIQSALSAPTKYWWTIFCINWGYIGRLANAKVKPGDNPGRRLYKILYGG